ncbi:acyltransferase family protein [Halobacillus sp. Marseille-Q1614]|uniref:acyltransferase family protein n=1 Tax=Halobacillus sp. Marseille-Q1614 TaxID=2709134 RepID=UPI00156FEF0C|nr:acyltransferase family protein [Halobacillus sp. Marseille-Q1614]
MKRDAIFDNAKILLIFLVVFGHMIQPTTNESSGMYTLYTWIYTFHMPAFIFLAGFFAKGSGNKNYIFKLAKKLILPYLIFQTIYTVFFLFIGKNEWLNAPFTPHWSLWFLFSLFCWHILLAVFKRIPPMVGITLSIVIGVSVGYVTDIGHDFSLSRTFVFFPFFLIGYWLTKEQVKSWRRPAVRTASVGIMAAVAVFIALAPEFDSGWLLGSKSYETLGAPEIGGVYRFGVYVIAALMSMSLLSWVPNKHYSFTALGGQTLYVYLLHGFIVQLFRQMEWVQVNNVIDIALYLVLSGVIVYLLSTSTIRTLTQPFIEGRAQLLRKQWAQINNDSYRMN